MAETARLSLYPTVEVKERLEALAVREGRTLNVQGCRLLEQALDAAEAEPPLGMRSIAVVGDRTIDMLTHADVGMGSLEPVGVSRITPRTTTCEHRIPPERHCRVCDA